jgi:5-hydroxyisourate hydrolase
MSISVYVLDCTHGVPAGGLEVRLERWGDNAWVGEANGVTGRSGRLAEWHADVQPRIERGRYRLVFGSGPYFAELGIVACFPEIVIVLGVTEPARHHEVVLLLSTSGYGTYCGGE